VAGTIIFDQNIVTESYAYVVGGLFFIDFVSNDVTITISRSRLSTVLAAGGSLFAAQFMSLTSFLNFTANNVT
jgi:hypothetical protein